MARTYRGVERRYGLAQRLALTLLVLPLGATTQAEITVDGSLGSFRGSLAGPDFQIDASLGRQVGSNLFHSFGAFNINHPESATFTANGSVGPIANVLGRVTGGSASTIDGVLRSTIPNANLFFINPHGVAFGPHAQLDVPGSFHVSTADYLRLEDGVRFETQPSAHDALLTTAPPAAFGFLGENPSSIAVQGSLLEVPEGKALSLVGGNLNIVGGETDYDPGPSPNQIARAVLSAPSGNLTLASVASAGEIKLTADNFGIESFARLAEIRLSQQSVISASGPGGGQIFIRGGRLTADNASHIEANTRGERDGKGIDIDVTGELKLDNKALIRTVTDDQGSAGDITLKAGKLAVHNGALISASTFGAGRGGDIQVEAADILLADGSEFFTGITAQAISRSTGAAGNVTVKADKLAVRNGAEISAFTHGAGRGGDVRVEASEILLSGDGSPFFTGINAEGGPGEAGNITVKAGKLAVRNGAQIFAGTFGEGPGGDVRVEAADILLSGDGSKRFTGIVASTFGTGRGGSIAVTARDIELSDRGGIFARSLSSSDSAVSGNIFIQAQDSLRIFDRGVISVETTQANAGNIHLNVGTLLHLRDNSAITTSVADGQGDGGNITIDPTFVVLDGSRIVANARAGRGGSIRIVSDFFFASPDSVVSASSDLGIDGMVEIESPDTDLNAGLVELPGDFFDVATLLTQGCAPGAELSRLVVRKYEVLPDSPAALRVPPPSGLLSVDAQNGEALGPGFEHASACDGDD